MLGSVLTIGNFDGVHAGHRQILRRVVELGREHNWQPAVLTFDPHPTQIVAPERAPRLLTTMAERVTLIREQGIEPNETRGEILDTGRHGAPFQRGRDVLPVTRVSRRHHTLTDRRAFEGDPLVGRMTFDRKMAVNTHGGTPKNVETGPGTFAATISGTVFRPQSSLCGGVGVAISGGHER